MSHPGIATRAQVVSAWLRENQVPPDVRAVLEAYVIAEECVSAAHAKKSALPPSAASLPADPPSAQTPATDTGGSADPAREHEHRATHNEARAGSDLVYEHCLCGAVRVSDYLGLVGERDEPKRGPWQGGRL